MLIDQIEYIKVIRKMDRIQLKIVEEIREMKLFEDHIKTKYHHFNKMQMLDVTYKPMSRGRATLFIHTDHGVYSYFTLEDPSQFIEKVKDIFKLNYT